MHTYALRERARCINTKTRRIVDDNCSWFQIFIYRTRVIDIVFIANFIFVIIQTSSYTSLINREYDVYLHIEIQLIVPEESMSQQSNQFPRVL